MAFTIKRIDFEVEMKSNNFFLIPKPLKSKILLLEIQDKDNKIHLSNYAFIDEVIGTIGHRYIWNNHKNIIEKLKVSITNDHKYKIQLPENLKLHGVFLS